MPFFCFLCQLTIDRPQILMKATGFFLTFICSRQTVRGSPFRCCLLGLNFSRIYCRNPGFDCQEVVCIVCTFVFFPIAYVIHIHVFGSEILYSKTTPCFLFESRWNVTLILMLNQKLDYATTKVQGVRELTLFFLLQRYSSIVEELISQWQEV